MADDNVVSLSAAGPRLVGDGFKVAVDGMLKAATGKGYVRLVPVGELPDGDIDVCGNDSAPESLMLLAWGQQFLVGNRVMRDD